MSNPRLLLLDEPSMGLAPMLVEKIFENVLSGDADELARNPEVMKACLGE